MTEDILFSRDGSAGRIVLNRPQALNALTYEMVVELHAQLRAWENDDSIKFVLLEGAGDKAFCAGGDIRALYDAGPDNSEYSTKFFGNEYRLNLAIKSYPKPYVSMMDGIVMGGGVGLSVPGRRRIVTEKTRCAMPETSIGIFPDVGGTYFLSRAPDNIGAYLGLTGDRMDAANCIYAGFADCMVPSDQLPELTAALCGAEFGSDVLAEIDALIQSFKRDPGPASLATLTTEMPGVFANASMMQIFTDLEELATEKSLKTLKSLKQKSPTSLKVTLQALRSAGDMNFAECISQEYRIIMRIIKNADFFEGARAIVIEKDGAPKWQPATLDQVSDDHVESYFETLGDLELLTN